MAGLNFNAETVAPNQAFENLAPAWYTAMITESEMKPTRGGDGSYLEITLEVIAPQQFAGRKLWDRLNLNNPSEKAVEIAYQTLSAICHATGVIQVQDSQQLHNIPMDVKVGLSKVTDEYPEPRNEVKGYRPVQGGTAAAPQGMSAPQGAPQAPQGMAAPQAMQQQAAPQQQAPQQQQWQQQQQAPQQHAPQQAEAPVTTYNQAPQNAAPQQQEHAPQQGGWQNAAPQQGAQQQQTAQAPQQQADLPPAEQHPQTNEGGQAAAQAGTPPWLVNQG